MTIENPARRAKATLPPASRPVRVIEGPVAPGSIPLMRLAEGAWAVKTLGWRPESWRSRPMAQQPSWPSIDALASVSAQLRLQRPLVELAECDRLRRRIAESVTGQVVLLQAGDCAERFASAAPSDVLRRLRVLDALADTFGDRAGIPVIVIGRMAGQYAKPRSAATESIRTGRSLLEVPSYRGDMVNGLGADTVSRRPDPRRVLAAYHYAAATIALVNGLVAHDASLLEHSSRTLYTSHEALVLEYEEALTRFDAATDAWFAGSAHFLWVGDRTRDPDAGHVEFLSGVANPIGVKLGPTARVDEVLRLCERLDPARRAGRLMLISRLGVRQVASRLPELVRHVVAEGYPAAWVCDPMHGNTYIVDGRKTRHVDDMAAEIASFTEIVRAEGGVPAGLHLEVAGEDVTECLGGPPCIGPSDLSMRYLTACDPRLNPTQARHLVARTASGFRPDPTAGASVVAARTGERT